MELYTLTKYLNIPIYFSLFPNGRFNHNFCRDEWDDSQLPTVGNLDDLEHYSLKNNSAYEVINSRNLQFFASFSRVSNKLAVLENSSVHALQFSMEACQNGIFINGIPQDESVELIGSSLRTDRESDTNTMFNVSTNPSDGDFRVFSALCTGYPNTILRATNADMIFQNSFVRLDERSSTIKLIGSDASVVRIENCVISRYTVSTSIEDVSGKRLELVGNHFLKGLEYIYNLGQIESTVNSNNLSGSIRLAEVANQGLVLTLD